MLGHRHKFRRQSICCDTAQAGQAPCCGQRLRQTEWACSCPFSSGCSGIEGSPDRSKAYCIDPGDFAATRYRPSFDRVRFSCSAALPSSRRRRCPGLSARHYYDYQSSRHGLRSFAGCHQAPVRDSWICFGFAYLMLLQQAMPSAGHAFLAWWLCDLYCTGSADAVLLALLWQTGLFSDTACWASSGPMPESSPLCPLLVGNSCRRDSCPEQACRIPSPALPVDFSLCARPGLGQRGLAQLPVPWSCFHRVVPAAGPHVTILSFTVNCLPLCQPLCVSSDADIRSRGSAHVCLPDMAPINTRLPSCPACVKQLEDGAAPAGKDLRLWTHWTGSACPAASVCCSSYRSLNFFSLRSLGHVRRVYRSLLPEPNACCMGRLLLWSCVSAFRLPMRSLLAMWVRLLLGLGVRL